MQNRVWGKQNECAFTGFETLCNELATPEGLEIRHFEDHKGWHRATLTINGEGVAGVVVEASGEIHWKHTALKHRGNNYTRQLQCMLTVWGVEWFPSENQSTSGAACYKSRWNK